MSDRFMEKSFLFLLILSLLLHLGVGTLLYYLPQATPPPQEPVFIDLQQVPDLKAQQQPRQQETPRQSEHRVRVPRETAPRGRDAIDHGQPAPPRPQVQTSPPPREASKTPPRETQIAPGSSAYSLLKPKSQSARQSTAPQLFPSASRLAGLEESYRRKFENEIAEGETRFLNSDDIQFGSFLRRFENAVYGLWRYPQEAAMKGIEGITPVRVTFNRSGEITKVQLLESSGAAVLDDEVLRTLKQIGTVGSFPKGYDKDEFHLIAFFQYGGARRSLR
ncbi:MAG: TonB family protein [Desulfuromonadales bacterium]|nr:TonB family protein [Desulfuromonadales bacterium]